MEANASTEIALWANTDYPSNTETHLELQQGGRTEFDNSTLNPRLLKATVMVLGL